MRAKEFIDEEVVPFPTSDVIAYKRFRDLMSDEEKYAMAVADQHATQHGEPDHMNPDYADPIYDPEVTQDMQNMGDPDYDTPGADTGLSSKDVDSMDLSPEALIALLRRSGMKPIDIQGDMEEGSKENANALVGSGRADPHGKKTNPDSAAHKKVRTPGTDYKDKRHRNQNWPATKPGANPGFVGE